MLSIQHSSQHVQSPAEGTIHVSLKIVGMVDDGQGWCHAEGYHGSRLPAKTESLLEITVQVKSVQPWFICIVPKSPVARVAPGRIGQ